jgi:two-component system alkaline phosphatase synthesis response regulator PhoP
MTSLLIIEDDALILRMYEQAFTFKQHKAYIADNGDDGFKKARTLHPDVILLDIMMPQMNGLEVLKKLKADPATKRIPVIMLTNVGQDEDIKTALYMGAVKYITKIDYSPKEVIDQVEEILAASTRDRVPE